MGHQDDASFVAAVAIGAAVFSALYWTTGFLRMGTTGLTAQAFGADNRVELGAIAGRGAILAIAIAALMLLFATPLHQAALGLFEAGPDAQAKAAAYVEIRFFGLPAMLLQYVLLGVLFGLQRMGLTLVLSLTTNVVNIVLNLLFVLGFGWGVAGVALGTVIAEWVSALLGIVLVLHGLRAVHAQRPTRQTLLDRARLLALFSVSGNLIVRSLFVQLPFLLFTVIGSRFGDTTLAANAILMQFLFTMAFFLDAFAHSAETLAGYAFGAGSRQHLRLATLRTGQWAMGAAALAALLFAGIPHVLVGLMTDLPSVTAEALIYVPWLAAAPLLSAVAFLLDGVYIGTTHIRILRNAMAVSFALYALTAWLALPVLGNHGLWLAMSVFFAVRSIILIIWYPGIEARLATS